MGQRVGLLLLLGGLAACRFSAAGLPLLDASRVGDGSSADGAPGDATTDTERSDGAIADRLAPDRRAPCPATSSWSTSVVASTVGTNTGDTYDPSIALDSAGTPHVAYYNYTLQQFVYATPVSGSVWTTETVGPTGGPNWHWWSTLAIDASNIPHVAYHKSGCNVMYATKATTTWSTSTLEGSAATFSLALDPAGKVHLAYSVTGGAPPAAGDLKLVTDASGPFPTTGAKIGDGHYASLAVDEQGHRHLAWYETPKQKLRYATDASGSWNSDYPDQNTGVGEFPSLVRRADGSILIAYYDRQNGDLKLATQAGGSWSVEVVESSNDVGRYPSLAISPDGTLNISHYDATAHDLRHTRGMPGSWTPQIVDSSGDVGRFPSLAIAADRKAHLVYFDDTNHAFKYATNTCR
jgi:hypothetical protein